MTPTNPGGPDDVGVALFLCRRTPNPSSSTTPVLLPSDRVSHNKPAHRPIRLRLPLLGRAYTLLHLAHHRPPRFAYTDVDGLMPPLETARLTTTLTTLTTICHN